MPGNHQTPVSVVESFVGQVGGRQDTVDIAMPRLSLPFSSGEGSVRSGRLNELSCASSRASAPLIICLAPDRVPFDQRERRVRETIDMRAVCDGNRRARERSSAPIKSTSRVFALRDKPAVLAVEPERVANLVHRHLQHIDAIYGVASRIAERPSSIEPSVSHVDGIGRVRKVFRVVPRCRVGEQADNRREQSRVVVEEDAGVCDAKGFPPR